MSTEATEAAIKCEPWVIDRHGYETPYMCHAFIGPVGLWWPDGNEEQAAIAQRVSQLPVLEYENAKLRALVQEALNGLEDLVYLEFRNSEGMKSGAPTAKEWLAAFDKAQQVIDAAKEQGFTPTNTTEAPTSEGSTTLAPTNTEGNG